IISTTADLKSKAASPDRKACAAPSFSAIMRSQKMNSICGVTALQVRSKKSAATINATGSTWRRPTVNGVFINDQDNYRDLVRQRRQLGHDRYDEVWDEVYVMLTLPNLAHQELVHDLDDICSEVVVKEGKGKV